MAYADLQPHQQRVVDEHNELHDRITRLELFIAQSPVFKTLPYTEQELLQQQRNVMDAYRFILRERSKGYGRGA